MKKIERLELENKALRNRMEEMLEILEIGQYMREREDIEEITLAKIKAVLEDYEEGIKGALETGMVFDCRLNAMTIGDCEYLFKKWGTQVIIHNGMILEQIH